MKIFTKKNTSLFVASIWITCFLIHFPNYVGWGSSKFSTGYQMCTRDMEVQSYSVFFGSMMLSTIGVTFIFYCKIYQTTKKSYLSVKIITGHQNNRDHMEQQDHAVHRCSVTFFNELKLAKTSFKIFVVFVIFWMPSVILTLIGIRDFVPTAVYLYSLLMAHSNSTLNFFVYYIDNAIFRGGFNSLLRRVMYRNVR